MSNKNCCNVELTLSESPILTLDALGDSYIGEMPTMSTVKKGGAKVGAGLEVDSDEFLNIAPSGVVSSMIDNAAITTEKLADGAVASAKVADESITPAKLSGSVIDMFDGNVKAFDTVAGMQTASNLQAGDICHTNGFHTAGDGGAAFYKITASGTANGMDVLACGDVFANLIIQNDVLFSMQIGCGGSYVTQTNVNRALSICNNVVFDSFNTSNPIVIDTNSKTITFDEINYSGNDYALTFKGDGNIIEFDRLSSSNGSGIKIDCTSKQFSTNKITGRLIITAGVSFGIECNDYGCIWNDIDIIRMKSSNAACIDMHCYPGTSSSSVSFIGQCNFNITQLEAPNDYDVKMVCDSNYSTITGIHFSPIAVENSQGGFYFNADSSGDSCEIKNVKVSKCRVFEQSSFTYFAEFVGACYWNEINCDSPIEYRKVKFDECTEQSLTRCNVITGGIFSPSLYKFASTMLIYNGHAMLSSDDGSSFFYKSGVDRTLYPSDSDSAALWRMPDVFYCDSGATCTVRNISHLLSGKTAFVSQNANNGSIVKLYDTFGTLLFDGSTLTATTRKYYMLIGRHPNVPIVVEITKQQFPTS